MKTSFLRQTLAQESKAYGFTIAFWGSGALLIAENGLPSLLEALAYGGGAVTGFGLLTLLVYHQALGKPEYQDSNIVILSMIHYLSALLPVVVTFYLAGIGSPWSFLLSGAAASILYNLGMVAEEYVSEEAQKFEQTIISGF